MRLEITEGHGAVVVFTVTAMGHPVTRIVIDPRNDTRLGVDLKTWIEDTGGARPLPERGITQLRELRD